jgi:hypothetical protein
VSTRNGEQPSEGSGSGIQDPPESAPPTESLETLSAEGTPEGAFTSDGPTPDSASPESGIRERASSLLQGLEPQKALGAALGAGILIALLLRWLRSR